MGTDMWMITRAWLVVIAALLQSNCLVAEDPKMIPELARVAETLRPLLERLDPQPVLSYSNEKKLLLVAYLPQVFMIREKSAAEKVEPTYRNVIGPAPQGFVLRIRIQPGSGRRHAMPPQTIRETHWLTDLSTCSVANADEQLFWALSYGEQTARSLLKDIRLKLSSLHRH